MCGLYGKRLWDQFYISAHPWPINLSQSEEFSCTRGVSDMKTHSSLSPPAGSCPRSRPFSSKHCRKSPRSTSVSPWRTKSCCGSCTMATCWRVPAASRPPHPSTRLETLPPSPQRHPYPLDNLETTPASPPSQAVPTLTVTAVSLDITGEVIRLEWTDSESDKTLQMHTAWAWLSQRLFPINFSSFSEGKLNNRHTSGSLYRASLSLWLSFFFPVFLLCCTV